LAPCPPWPFREALPGAGSFFDITISAPPVLPEINIELVHESTHQENPAAGGAKQIFLGEGVRNIGEQETSALVQYVNNHLVCSEVHGKVDFLVRAFLVSIVEGVDHALAHTHTDAIAVVLSEPRRFRHSETQLLGELTLSTCVSKRNF